MAKLTLDSAYEQYKKERDKKQQTAITQDEARDNAYREWKAAKEAPIANNYIDRYNTYAGQSNETATLYKTYLDSGESGIFQSPDKLTALSARVSKENRERMLLQDTANFKGYDAGTLTGAAKYYDDLVKSLGEQSKYYGQFKGQDDYTSYLGAKAEQEKAQKAKDEYEKWLEQYLPQTQYTPGNQDREPVTELKVDDVPDSKRIGPASRVPGFVGYMAGNNLNMTDQGNRIPGYVDPRNIAHGPKIPTVGSTAVSDEDRQRDMYKMGGPDEARAAMRTDQKTNGRSGGLAQPEGWDYDAARQQDVNRVTQEDEMMRLYGPKPGQTERSGALLARGPAAITGGRGMNRIADLPALAQQEYEQNTAKGAESVMQRVQAERDALQTKRNELFTEITQLGESIRWDAPSPQDPEAYRAYIGAQQRKQQAEQELAAIDEQLKPVDQRMTEAQDQLDILQLQEQYAGMEGYAPAQEAYQQKLGALEYKADWNKMAPVEQFGVWLGDRSKRAALNLNEAIYAVPDMIAGWVGADKMEWSKNNEKALSEVQRNIAVQSSQMNWAADAIGDVITTGIEMVPTILLAIASGGTSLAAQGTTNIATAGGTFGARLAQTALALFKSPVFLNTYFREFGQNLSELRASGVPDMKAIVMSTQMAFPNSLIEGIGGPEAAAKSGPGIINWFINSAGEGVEEPVQGIVSKVITAANSGDAMFNLTIDDIISLTNKDAIISVPRAAEEAIKGVAAGLFMGGMQAGASSLMDTTGRAVTRARSMSAIQDYTLKLTEFSSRFPADHPVAMWSQYVKPDVPGAASAILASLEMDAMNAVPGSPEQMQAQQDADTFLDITRNLYNASAQFAAAQPKGKMEQETPAEPQKPIQEALDYQAEYNASIQRAEQPQPAQAPAEDLDAAQADDEIIDDTQPYVEAPEAPPEPLIQEITEQAAPEPLIAQTAPEPEQPTVSYDTIPAQEQPAPVVEEQPAQQPTTGAQFTTIAGEYARAGLRISDLAKVIGTENITPEVNQAYEKGMAAAKATAEKRAQEILGRGPVEGRKGFVRSISAEDASRYKVEQVGRMTPTLRAATAGLRNLADASGLNFVVYESPINRQGEHIGRRGFYDRKTGTVYLDVKAGKGNEEAILSAAGHEITHFIEQYAPEFYHNQYRQAVIDEFYNGDEDAYAELIKDQIDIAKSNGKTISEAQAAREVIAEASSKMLFGSKETLQRLVGENPRLFTRIKNWIDNFIKSLQRAFTLTQSDPEASKILQGSMERFKAIQSNWWHAFEDAAVNLRGEDGPNKPSAYDQARQARRQYQPKPAAAIVEEAPERMSDAEAIAYANAMMASLPKHPPIQERIQTIIDEHTVDGVIDWDASLAAYAESNLGFLDEDNGIADAKSTFEKYVSEYRNITKQESKAAAKPATPLDALMENKSYSRKFKNLVKKWAANEWVNIDLNKPGEKAESFIKFGKKWYNIGRGALSALNYEDNDANYPPFLQDEFKKAGAELAAAKKGAKPNVRGNEGPDNGRIEEAGIELPGGREADIRPGIQPDNAGQEAGGILAEVPAEDVQPVSGPGDAAPAVEETISPVSQDDNRSNADGDAGEPSLGVGGRGDLQPETRNVTDEIEAAVSKAVAQHHANQNSSNFNIGPEGLDLPTDKKARYEANVAAIRIAKALEAEGRSATYAEQVALSKFVGWGGLAEVFERRAQYEASWGKAQQELKDLLTEEEYEAANKSIMNAHYTDIGVVLEMHAALARWGFDGGNILEPAVGSGNFIGATPAYTRQSNWLAVELDPMTSLIAKQLYPKANVLNMGFQDAPIPDNYFDLAISNVPFSDNPVFDKKYPAYLRKNLHNYFFVKAMDKVRPGGVLMFITSRYTMDGKDQTFRKYIAGHADFMGGVRLPNSAFKENADTSVVTDVLVFRKREQGAPYAGVDFARTGTVSVKNNYGSYSALPENEYFIANPSMVLGTPVYSSRYSGLLDYVPKTETPLREQMNAALAGISFKIEYPAIESASPDALVKAVDKARSKKPEGAIVIKGDKAYQVVDGVQKENARATKNIVTVKALFELRDMRSALILEQLRGGEKAAILALRKKLNKAYDAFVKEHGYINDPQNANLIADDPDSYGIMSLENYTAANARKKTAAYAEKSDIFTRDTVSRKERATSAASLVDAVSISMNETGATDIARVAELLSTTPEKAGIALVAQGLAFKDRAGAYIPASVYLSGKVRAKLDEAKALANIDPSYEPNVRALEKVIPEDVPLKDISINIGTAWVPTDVYAQFIRDLLGRSWDVDGIKVQKASMSNTYKVELSDKAKKAVMIINDRQWGAGSQPFTKIFERMMNEYAMKVTYTAIDEFGNKHTVVDKDASNAVAEKAERINEAFQKWVATDADRSKQLERLYNDTFNDLIQPEINGDLLSIDGMNPEITLLKHQKDVIQRAVSMGGNILIAHATGAGKTAEMAAIAMKLRQIGTLKKPMFVVPKSVVSSWGKDFLKFFPAARILSPSDSDFEGRNRKLFVNKIASGDYDAVIVSEEIFESIPLSPKESAEFYRQQIDELMQMLHELEAERASESADNYGRNKQKRSDFTEKQVQKAIDKLQTKLKRTESKNKRDEDIIDFEALGVDGLFVDEVQEYKNLVVMTKMGNVQGIKTSDEPGKAQDMLMKVRYMQKLNQGRGIVFATATPVMNSLAELYVMQKYLRPDMLADRGITSFDAWAKQFARVVNEFQLTVTADKMEVKRILSRFNNVPELQTMIRTFMDIKTMIEELAPLLPKIKGGKAIVNEVEPGEYQKLYMRELVARAEAMKGKRSEKGGDNMLSITNDGREISYTGRMKDSNQPLEQNGKIVAVANNVRRIWSETAAHKGAQLVFMDRGVNETSDKISLYKVLKEQLVFQGIPASEIAFIHDPKNEAEKMELFERVRDGDIRVLIGSSQKMGVGVNVQDRLAAMHHVDVPWRPGDLTQRDGRMIRRGNIFKDLGGVEMHYYVTKGTFDAYMWQKLQTKATFIQELMDGKSVGRDIEGDGLALTAAEVTAIASGNPLVMERFKVQNNLKKLRSLYSQYKLDAKQNRQEAESNKRSVEYIERSTIPEIERDIKKRISTKGDAFQMKIGGKVYMTRAEAGAKLIDAYNKGAKNGNRVIASIGGFDLTPQNQNKLTLNTERPVDVWINPDSALGTIQSIEATLTGFDSTLEKIKQDVERKRQEIPEYERLGNMPFDKLAELEATQERFNEIMAILGPSLEETMNADTASGDADADADDGSSDSIDNALRRLTAEDFLQLNPEDPARLQDRKILANRLDDILNADRDPRQQSARQMLANAFNTIAINDYDKSIIERYKARMATIETDATALDEINRKIKELSFAPGERNMAELAKLKNNKETLRNKIARQDAGLLKLENAKPIASLLTIEKQKAAIALKTQRKDLLAQYRQETKEKVTAAKEKGAEKLSKYKDNQSSAHYRERIKEISAEISEWITNPTGKKYVPEVLRTTIGDFLLSINEASQRSLRGGDSTIADRDFRERLATLRDTIRRLRDKQQSESGELVNDVYESLNSYFDLPDNYLDELTKIVDSTKTILESASGEHVLNRMDAAQLKKLDELMRTLASSIKKMNKTMMNKKFERVDSMGVSTITDKSAMKSKLTRTGAVDRFLNWDNIEPYYAFERMGEAGRSIFEELMAGQDRMAKNSKEIVDFAEKTFTKEESRVWSKELHTFNLHGKELTLTTAHLMALYCLNKRDQARGHIYGGGIRVSDFKIGSQRHADGGHVITEDAVNKMLSKLTAKQLSVAKALQHFMATRGAELGNQVSLARFDTLLFGGEGVTYFPIESVRENMDENMDAPEGNPLYRLLNLSMTKGLTEGANNQLMVHNIFDVFAAHMSDMAQYNALALPILDAVKWYNFRQSYLASNGQKHVDSVKGAIRNAFGDPALSYLTQLLKDINGARVTTGGEGFLMNAVRHYNRSAVAANLRVALLQPTSIMRAHNVIDARYLTAGSIRNLARMKLNIREMEKYSGIAAWKQMGFYDVNLSRSLQDMIKRDDPLLERVTGKTMLLPQTMDRITWAAMWEAAKLQTAAQHPRLGKNTPAFFVKVQELFDKTIYATQVVDSMLTRSDYMRKTTFGPKWTSSFMSEPTKTYNILANQVHAYNDAVASGQNRGQAWSKHGKAITRTIATYAASVVLVTMVEALTGAWRDDDEFKTFWEKLMAAGKEALIDNLMPLNLPIINDLWELFKNKFGPVIGPAIGIDMWGFEDTSPLTQGLSLLSDGVTALIDRLGGKETRTTDYGIAYKLLQGASAITGHPMAGMTREVVDLWNHTVAIMYPQYNVKRYDASSAGGFDALWESIEAGDTDATTRLRAILDSKGEDDKTILSGLQTRAKEAYQGGKLTQQRAIDILAAQPGADKDDVYWLTRKWEDQKQRNDWSAENYGKYDLYMQAITTGSNLRKYMDELLQHGGTKSAIAGVITDKFKPLYITASTRERAEIKARLLNAYTMLGYDRDDRSRAIDAWLKPAAKK